jgi:acyl-CoA dehydrogenase
MDFAMSAKAADYHKRLSAFMTEHVFPAEAEYGGTCSSRRNRD